MRLQMQAFVVFGFLASLTTGPLSAEEDGFVPLLESDDIHQFTLVEIDSDTIQIEDGVISVTGRPNGYFATKNSHKDYVVRFDWRYERPEDLQSDADFNGNSGLLVHIQEPHKVWPQCIEVQLLNRDAGHIFAIGGSEFQSIFNNEERRANQEKGIKPVGEWNEMEVICEDGAITCRINDVLIDRGTGASPEGGPIGWQSEGRPIQFRNMMLKALD